MPVTAIAPISASSQPPARELPKEEAAKGTIPSVYRIKASMYAARPKPCALSPPLPLQATHVDLLRGSSGGSTVTTLRPSTRFTVATQLLVSSTGCC